MEVKVTEHHEFLSFMKDVGVLPNRMGKFIFLVLVLAFGSALIAFSCFCGNSSIYFFLLPQFIPHDLLHQVTMQVDLLKHGIPDPSSIFPSHTQSSNMGPEKENKDKVTKSEEYMAVPIFVHTK